MKSFPVSGPPVTVGALVRRRLKEMGRTVPELAEAVEVPVEYIEDVIAGDRQPTLGRSDIYERMTSFLGLGRNDLASCLPTPGAKTKQSGPGAQVRGVLLGLCEPGTAEVLEQRRGKNGSAELAGLCQRVLDVAQGAVRRVLEDHTQLRLAAAECGRTYPDMRFRVLDFLDATPATVTVPALNEFLTPRIARWDVDLETGVLRVVMRPTDRSQKPKRRVSAASAAPSLAARAAR